jgi:hypothetical protein
MLVLIYQLMEDRPARPSTSGARGGEPAMDGDAATIGERSAVPSTASTKP